jgi:hypothetical protein
VLDLVRRDARDPGLDTGNVQGLVEYALIIVLISIESIVVMAALVQCHSSVFPAGNASPVSP